MRGQLSLVTRLFFITGMLIMLVVFTSELSFYNAEVRNQVSRYDLVYAAQDLASALISENCLLGDNALTREKLDLFAAEFNSSEHPCARLYGYGYTAKVETFPLPVKIAIVVGENGTNGGFAKIENAEFFTGIGLIEDRYSLVIFAENSVSQDVSWVKSKRIFFPQEDGLAMGKIYAMHRMNASAKVSTNSSGMNFAAVYSYAKGSDCETIARNDNDESVVVKCGDDLFVGLSENSENFQQVAPGLAMGQAGIAPKASWEFGAGGISRIPQVSFGFPVIVDYDGADAPGKLSISVASGELERVAGAIDYACASGKDSNLNIVVKNRLYLKAGELCVDYGDAQSCRRIECGKIVEMPDLLPGTHSITVRVGERIEVSP
ncbi:Uncharacterised protein [Candidatus Gugararchaeum adminiculabundum]|nr:Uncharacterised protein [Candidatus Gugararchaeum adminiculabundum]